MCGLLADSLVFLALEGSGQSGTTRRQVSEQGETGTKAGLGLLQQAGIRACGCGAR